MNVEGGCIMYRELLENFIQDHRWAKLREPCSENEIAKAEEYVGFPFPEDLKALFRETNGDGWLLLSVAEMIKHVKTNREIFPEYLEPDEFREKIDRYVFFATNGCGDYYCYRVLPNGKTDDSAIYIWEHELFEIRKVAENIADLIGKYYRNEI